MFKSLLLFFLILAGCTLQAQPVLEIQLDGSEQGKPLPVFLKEVEQKVGVRFYFRTEWLEQFFFDDSYRGKTLKQALEKVFQGTDLSYFFMSPLQVVIIKDFSQSALRANVLETAIRQRKKIIPYTFGDLKKSVNDRLVVISGRVVDAKTKEPLINAAIAVSDNSKVFITDELGNYRVSLVPGAHVLTFSFADHEDRVIDLIAYADGKINLEMDDIPILLEEVVVQDREAREITTNRIGQVQMSMKELKRAPAMLGEVDLVKQVQTLAGVTTVGEAASGFNVRGGSVDQNLILYDGMPVFNSAHVFGFFSAFNSEAIRDVSFYRGGIPAEFGGRASSVLDIKSKDGNYKRWNGSGGIGMLTSNLMLNGPLVKDKTSLAASFRSTYSNWLIHSVKTNYADLSKSNVSFYDGTLKLAHLYSQKTKLSLTGYASKDAFRLLGDSTYQWTNLQLSAQVDHQLSEKLAAEFAAGVSSYGYNVVNADFATASELSYRITTTLAKAGFHFQEGNKKINFGWQLLHYQFDPGILKPNSPISNAKSISMDKQYSIESAFHASKDWLVNKNILVEGGLRLPIFVSFGPGSVNIYKEGGSIETTNQINTLTYKTAEPIKSYVGLEPRLSARWLLSATQSFKLGYNRMYQFLHLVTNTTAVTPVDIWQPSGYYFKPQIADQVSVGYFADYKEKKYGLSTEVFYKTIQNVLDFKDGAQLILNTHLETDLRQGASRSYGIETSLTKNTGRITGSLNYTYSRSFRTIPGINSGNQYASNFDQPHVVNLAWKYSLGRRIFFTGNFTYHSGRPVTIPLSVFTYENNSAAYFSERNQYRIADYHRLDVALVIEGNSKRKKKGESTWVFSVYNVYGRKNPYAIFFKNSALGIPQPYQLSIIGTLLPSVSYNFKFL